MRAISKYSQTVHYNLRTTLDNSGIAKLQAEIRHTQNELQRMASMDLVGRKQLDEAMANLNKLQDIVNKSFNANLGMLDMRKFTSGLKEAGQSISSLSTQFRLAGTTGEIAFNNLVGRLGKLDTGIRSVSQTTDKIFNTLGNTVRWGVIASGFQGVMNSLRSSAQYVRDLDTSLTNIMMVTDYSKQQMNDYAKSANQAAKALGSTTVAMTDATLVFAQQGFDLPQSSQLAEMSTKLANVSQQDTATTSDQITAYMNAYGMDDNMAQLASALDSWAEVANVSAADVQELATASQKAASTASTVGVNMDQLAAQIATIESVTREAPENIGNGLKTIYSRFSDIKAGETLEDGVDLGQVTQTLDKVGVDVLDPEGAMRNVGDIMEDLMGVWTELDQTQKAAISTTLAGRYQLSRFMALMNRSDLYDEYKEASMNADGTMDEMNERYINSMEGRLNSLQASVENIFNNLFNSDDFYDMIGALTELIDLMNTFVESIGGGTTALTGLGAVATKVFSNNLASGISNFMTNRERERIAKENPRYAQEFLGQNGLQNAASARNRDLVNFVLEGQQKQQFMTTENQEQFNTILENSVDLKNKELQIEDQIQQQVAATNALYRQRGVENQISYDKEGNLISHLNEEKLIEGERNLGMGYILTREDVSKQDLQFLTEQAFKVDNVRIKLAQARQELNAQPKNIQSINANLERTVQGAKTIAEQFGKGSIEAQEIGKGIKELYTVAEAGLDIDENLQKADMILSDMIRKANNLVKGFSNPDISPLGLNEIDQRNLDLTQIRGDVSANDSMQKDFIEGISRQERIAGIVNMAGAIGQLAFAWQSFQALGSIWQNSDLEVGEKLFQTILNLGMTLPMVVTGIRDFVTGMRAIKSSIMIAGTARLANAAATTAETAAMTKNTAATAAHTAATVATTGATAAATGATVSFGAALWAVLQPILPIVGAIGLLTGGVIALVNAYNAESNAAASAKGQADNLKASYDSLKASHDELNSNLEGYNTARQALRELEQGTDEWNTKLQETNDQLISILEKYPELAQYVSRGSDGTLGLDEAGFREFEELQQQRLLQASSAQKISQVNANQKQLEADETSLRRSIGTAGITEDRFYQLYDLIEQEGAQSLYNAETLGSILNVSSDSPLVKSVIESADKIVAQFNERENQNRANDLLLEQAMLENLQGREDFTASETEAVQIANVLANSIDTQSQAYQSTLQEIQANSIDATADMYAKEMGWTKKSTDFFGNTATFIDDQGTEQVLDMVAVEQFLASSQAMDEAASKWQEVASQLADIANSRFSKDIINQDASSLLGSWKAGGSLDISSLSGRKQGNIETVLNEKGGFSAEELGVSDEWAQAQGFESGASFAQSFSNGLREALNRENAFDNLLNSLEPVQQEGYETDKQFAESERYQEQRNQVLALADDIDKLDRAYSNGFLLQNDYNDGLLALSKNYQGLESEIEAVRKAQKKYTDAVEDYDIEGQKEASEELTEAQEELQEAIIVKDWEKAASSCQEYYDIMQEAGEGTEEYSDAAQNMADVLSDLTGINVDPDWIEGNPELIQNWLAGVEGAASAVRAALGTTSDGFSQYVGAVGGTVKGMTDAVSGLQFDVQGNADFSPILNELFRVRGDSALTMTEAQGLADILASIGTTSLQFEQNGELVTLDIQSMISKLNSSDADVAMEGLAELNEAISAFKGNATVTGTVPASGVPRMTPAPSSPGGPSGGGGGKKGGGGGSGKSYEPKSKDPIKEEIDRYERVDTLLQAVENDFDKIADEQDRLTGFDQADNMNEQIALLQRQIALHKEKLQIQKEEAAELRRELSSQYGITFDTEGFISNYAATHRKLEGEVNSLINQYNSTTSEAGQEALEKQIEEAEERLEDFKEAYERYDELVSSDMKDTIKSIEDLKDNIEDLNIEAFQTSVEAADNIKDIQEALVEFNAIFTGLQSDDPFREMGTSAAKLKNYFDVATTSVNEYYDTLIARMREQANDENITAAHRKFLENQIKVAQEAKRSQGDQTMEAMGTGYLDMAFGNLDAILREIDAFEQNGVSSIFGENSAELYDTAKTIFEQATGMIEDFEGEIDNLRDAILDAIGEIADEMERRREAYEGITEELEHQYDIIEMLQGDKAYGALNEVLAAQQNNNRAQIFEMQEQIKIWKDLQSAMTEGSDEWLEIQEQITDTQSELNDLITDSIENLQEQYNNTVSKITDQWINDALGTDLDWMGEQWELINRNADYYLDQTNAAYNIQKLQGRYLELLDGSNDLHTQQMITEQMKQQLAYLREKKNISEYDVAYANAQLEILQKRIALEEAQRNKSQMKLRRDSQGNYSYVYTANEGDIAGAEGDLLDAQNNAYNLSKEQMKQTQDDSFSALNDAKALIDQIWTDANLSLEEKKARTQTIIDSLKEYLAGTSEQLSTSEQNIINDFVSMVEMMTGENASRLEDVYNQIINGNKDAFDQIDTRWSTSLTQWMQNLDDFNINTDSAFEQLVDNGVTFQENIDSLGELVQQDFNDMSAAIQETVDKTEALSSGTQEFIDQLKNDAGVVKDYEKTLQSYADKISDVTNEMRAYQDQVNELSNKLTAKEQENANLNSQIKELQAQNQAYKDAANGGGAGGAGGGAGGGDGVPRVGEWVTYVKGKYYHDSYGMAPAGSRGIGKKAKITYINWNGSHPIHLESSDSAFGWVKQDQIAGYDTGGYTGEWGDGKNGRLAFLHQKEMVLNADDTLNILRAVDSVRQMVDSLKAGGISSMITSMNNHASGLANGSGSVQQDVHITADFPNVRDSKEIEEALLSLNDTAITYAWDPNKLSINRNHQY